MGKIDWSDPIQRKLYDQQYHQRNKGRWDKTTRRREIMEWYRGLKNGPCMDCGYTFHPVCMDYDHREDEVKLHDIAYMASNGWSKDKILVEISKCDLVCANCHRIRTYIRANQSVGKEASRLLWEQDIHAFSSNAALTK